MKQAILFGARDLRLEDRDLDVEAMGPDDVFVRTDVTALSTGTDLGNYLGRSTDVPGAPDYPRAVGYSNAGTVVRAGENVRHLREGQRVFSLRPHQSAYIARADELLVPVPDSVSSESASLTYLAQLGLAALRQAAYQPGENVAVVGLGVIGLCTVALVRALGGKVVAVANSAFRAELASRIGADAAIIADDSDANERIRRLCNGGADVVVLTANSWSAYRTAVEVARTCGRVSILGFPGRGQPPPEYNPFDPRWFYDKSLALIGVGPAPRVESDHSDLRFNLRRNLEFVLELMASGALELRPVISHRFPSNSMAVAYELARLHDRTMTGAVFDWRSAEDKEEV